MKKNLKWIIGGGVLVVLLAVLGWWGWQMLQPSLEFKKVRDNAAVDSFAVDVAPIKGALDYIAWSHYEEINTSEALNDALCSALRESKDKKEFALQFADLVEDHYWQGYDLHLSLQTELTGHRGTLTVTGDKIPDTAYGIMKILGTDGKTETQSIPVTRGVGYYNLYGKEMAEATLYLAADAAGKEALSATRQVEISPLYLPDLFISELSNQHTVTYYSDLENDNKQHRGSQEQKFQYIELHNYSDTPVALSEYTFVYNDQVGEHRFAWLTETDASLTVAPNGTFVIGVYSADTVKEGLGYETDADKAAYWNAFNAFYNTEIPVGRRAMIACVASGDGEKLLDGIDHLERSKDAGVTVSAELRQGDRVITRVNLPDEMPANSYAYQFLPGNGVEQAFLCTTGCFPGKLLTEQQLSYCETPAPKDAEIIKAVSYNVLATDKNPAEKLGSVAYRSKLFFRFIEDYRPDVIGLQEVNFRWAPLLSEQMAAKGYGEVQGISGENHTYENINRRNQWDLINPIYYNTARYELLESGDAFLTIDGTFDTEQWDSVNRPKRSVTWAVLRDKTSGDVVTHLNTHLILSGKLGRVEQVKAICAKGAELQKKYGGITVVTGDHNMAEGSEPYHTYINSGMLDSKYQTTHHNSLASYTDFDTAYNERYGAPIDFCFVSPNTAVSKYQVFGGRYSDGIISDHSAILTELYPIK